MHPDSKNAIRAAVAVFMSLMGLLMLCFLTYGTMFFSGVFVLTIVYLIIVKVYVIR